MCSAKSAGEFSAEIGLLVVLRVIRRFRLETTHDAALMIDEERIGLRSEPGSRVRSAALR
jgi:hypothetical protein